MVLWLVDLRWKIPEYLVGYLVSQSLAGLPPLSLHIAAKIPFAIDSLLCSVVLDHSVLQSGQKTLLCYFTFNGSWTAFTER